VVVRVVGDVAGDVGLLDATDTVLEARGAGNGPRPGQRLGVAQERVEDGLALGVAAVGLAGERDVQVGELVDTRDAPRLGPVGEVAVGEQDDRGAVCRGDPDRVEGGGESVGGRPGRDDRDRRLAVATEHRLEEGPPRWTSTIMSGSSRETARPMVSDFRASPGPEVVVTPMAPPKLAPRAIPMPAISSSAWIVVTPCRLRWERAWRMSDAGVMGYEPRTSGSPAR
jgi:hypothetical protein